MRLFLRGSFQELWLTLLSYEPLGILDTGFLEDWFGQDGQVSLLHVPSGRRFPVPMTSMPADSQGNFIGSVPLAALANGIYAIQGRVRDRVGNVTVLGDYHAMDGSERVLPLGFELADSAVVVPVVRLGPVVLQGGMRFPASLPFFVNPQGERICSKGLSVSGFLSRQGVTLPAPMR
jgi:hypothetical protein